MKKYPAPLASIISEALIINDFSLQRNWKKCFKRKYRGLIYCGNGKFLFKFGGYSNGAGQFSSPRGVAVDKSNNIYVVDGNNHRIQVFQKNGTFIRQFGSFGTGNAQFISPSGIIVDPKTGNIIISEIGNHRYLFHKYHNRW